jgi:hypothetical protein
MRTTSDEMFAKSQTDCIVDPMAFLVNADLDGAIYGAVHTSAALELVQVMLGYDEDKFEKLKKCLVNEI